MNNSKGLIIILTSIIVVLIIALAGAITYIVLDNDNAPVINNLPEIENEIQNNQDEVIEDNNVVEGERENNEENEVENEDENVEENETQNPTETPEEDNVIDNSGAIPPEQSVEQIVTDMDKLVFNTTLTKYLGNITGEKLNSLLRELQTSNEKNPNHIVTLSSNNLPNLDGIGATDIYTITFSYGEDGYVNNINIDKKI